MRYFSRNNKQNIISPSQTFLKPPKNSMCSYRSGLSSVPSIPEAQSQESQSQLSFGQSIECTEKGKLLQLTGKCMDYYKRFLGQKQKQLNVLQKVFRDIGERVYLVFHQIIQQVNRKQEEILIFLDKQECKFLQKKRLQQQSLKNYLGEIKSVHLSKIIQKQQGDTRNLLTSYATTINNFLNLVFQIQKSSYQDNLDQDVNFISDLLNEEIRNIIDEKIPQKLKYLINLSFGNGNVALTDRIQNQSTIREKLLNGEGVPLDQEQDQTVLKQKQRQQHLKQQLQKYYENSAFPGGSYKSKS